MNTVVYLGNNIQILEGAYSGRRIQIKRAESFGVPENVLENRDAAAFADFLKEIWSKGSYRKRNVSLCLHGRFLSVGQFCAPDAPGKTVLNFVKRELAKYEEDECGAYSYVTLSKNSKNKTKTVLAAKVNASDYDFITGAFLAAGIELCSVCFGLGQLVSTLGNEFAKDRLSCILQLCEDKSITNVLFLNGEYVYSSITRIEADHGDVRFSLENARAVSGILQFMKANGLEYDENSLRVLMHGFLQEDHDNCVDGIGQMNPYLDVSDAPDLYGMGGRVNFLAAAGFYPLLPYSNMMAVHRAQDMRRRRAALHLEAALPFVITAAASALLLCAALMLKNSENNKLQRLIEQNEALETDVAAYDELVLENSQKELALADIKTQKENILSYPLPDSASCTAVLEAAGELGGAKITGYDGEAGVLYVEITFGKSALASEIIKRISALSVVDEVKYTGYSYDQNSGLYVAVLSCVLGGREADT